MKTPTDIKAAAERRWRSGDWLRAALDGDAIDWRQPLSPPSGRALGEHYDAVRRWIAEWRAQADRGLCELHWRTVNHRQLGPQQLPASAHFRQLPALLRWLGHWREASAFRPLAKRVIDAEPALAHWLRRRPHAALAAAEDWPALLATCAWLRIHPRPLRYLREIDAPGVDSKFLHRQRALLGELLEHTLDPAHIDAGATGLARHGFERRFGFAFERPQIRLRLLDPAQQLGGLRDIAAPIDQLAALDWPAIDEVFVTENKTNGLSFPARPRALVIFGLGYGVDSLGELTWLRELPLYYWGDIDTHGFAILDRLRAQLPQARSLLMDRDTLLAHRPQWEAEPQQHRADLTRLETDEAALYRELLDHRHGDSLRLEQEQIGFDHLYRALARL